ncbi:MAG: serine/threonine protein kinase [Planctomycetales bacterium]
MTSPATIKPQVVAARPGGPAPPLRFLLRRGLWIWPLVAALLLAAGGYAVRQRVESALKRAIAAELQTLLDADVAALRIWMQLQEANAQTVAADRDVAHEIRGLVDLAASPEGTAAGLRDSPLRSAVHEELQPWLAAHQYSEYLVIDSAGRILDSPRAELVGSDSREEYRAFLETVLSGRATVSRPFASYVPLLDDDGVVRTGVPTMIAAAPVRDDSGEVHAAICLRMRPDQGFTRILQVARLGQTGETFAFDGTGLLLSESRFNDELVDAGLIPSGPVVRSALAFRLREPPVNLAAGASVPAEQRDQWPLTQVAQRAIAGGSGFEVDGYRDYRGQRVVAAWMWLEEYGIGVANKVDVAEAFGPLSILRNAFWGLFGLLGVSSVGLGIGSLIVVRLQRAAIQSALKLKQLGQYVLERKLGVGGMGVVYLGRHALLRRPTAIKLIEPDKANDTALKRFEREVVLTCRLNHPNTIAIYDYGRTPEGLFYYAMEYLDGLTLQQLVDRFGPQPDGRVARILEQVCGSLAEAHDLGLVHRDIKPANIMLNQRGGLCDFVKVLDFGLVRTAGDQQAGLTAAGVLTGTPLYMSPESIESPQEVDGRSDLYAVGAVGYYLLTGRPVFVGTSVVEVCMQHFNARPTPPSEILGRAVSGELEGLLLGCLAKRPADRPATARELAQRLAQCAVDEPWSASQASAWWRDQFGRTPDDRPPSADAKKTHPPGDATLILGEQTF